MSNENPSAGGTAVRDIPIDWEALEDAFENNAPEVHSYLHLVTGDVLRVVDGVADPQMHARIAADANYLRIDPVSSREQHTAGWSRYIPMVEDPDLQAKLNQAIDGKGAFRRASKDDAPWRTPPSASAGSRSAARSGCASSWRRGSALTPLNPVARPIWVPEVPARPGGAVPAARLLVVGARPAPPGVEHVREELPARLRHVRRGKSVEDVAQEPARDRRRPRPAVISTRSPPSPSS